MKKTRLVLPKISRKIKAKGHTIIGTPAPEVLFTENFDSQPDWVGGDINLIQDSNIHSKTGIPPNWTTARSAPYAGFGENMEILASNSDKRKGGSGKSLVVWRHHKQETWGNDKILFKDVGERDSVYVEAYVQFDANWLPAGLAKFIRIMAWNRSGDPFLYFGTGDAGPIFIWDMEHTITYGIGNVLAFRQGPYALNSHLNNVNNDNYFMSPTPAGFSRQLSAGDVRMNFETDLQNQDVGGTDSKLTCKDSNNLTDYDNYLVDISNRETIHDDIFGPIANKEWTKIALYVSMNSAPGATDGVLAQWIDDKRTFFNSNIPWLGIDANEPGRDMSNIKWNMVGFGGNELITSNDMTRIGKTDEDLFSAYYAFDDIKIRTAPPPELSLAP